MRDREGYHPLNTSAGIVTLLCLLLWTISHFRAIEIGLLTANDAYGVGTFGGSFVAAVHDQPSPGVKPFLNLVNYDTFSSGAPEAIRTLLGRFSFGKNPDYPWIEGASIPMWFLTLSFGIAWFAGFLLLRKKSKRSEAN
ncbi:MAG: hypothetical protein AAGF67_03950 [Verrucomicrobiota bacterium]